MFFYENICLLMLLRDKILLSLGRLATWRMSQQKIVVPFTLDLLSGATSLLKLLYQRFRSSSSVLLLNSVMCSGDDTGAIYVKKEGSAAGYCFILAGNRKTDPIEEYNRLLLSARSSL